MKTKKLFACSSREITCAFSTAQQHKYFRGLKLLKAPSTCLEGKAEHGKLLVVTPRACGKAHARNKIRRQLRALFYEKSLYQHQAFWIILVRKNAMELTFEQLEQFLQSAITL